ncbi:MAG TPA: diguanylate cyclase [Streptosporangiaceae bacterium]|nr:diguanylate cyclase [Streptosporangiaceae bacterium]
MAFHSQAATLNGLAADINLLDPDLPVAVAVADLDGFGRLNQAHGAEAGDAVLGAFEAALTGHLPAGALVAHVRGDEFAVALPDMTCEEALLALEQIRAGFAGREQAPGVPDRVGVSFGIAGRPAHGSTAEELLEAADAGLVRAKRAGGNRIAIHVEERMILKSSYYPRPALHRLTKLARRTGRPEASLLREALDDYLERNRALL